MEQQNTFHESQAPAEPPLSLPHFDEEATLNSARPVVPLHEVKAKSRSRRRLLLGAALFVAASVGALTASMIYSRVGQVNNDSAATQDGSSVPETVASSGEAMGSSVNSNEAADLSEPNAQPIVPAKTETMSRDSVSSKKQPIEVPRSRKQPERLVSSTLAPNRDDQDRIEEMETRREQRREARRLRRERRVNDRTGEGLTRIREIFEGAPRP